MRPWALGLSSFLRSECCGSLVVRRRGIFVFCHPTTAPSKRLETCVRARSFYLFMIMTPGRYCCAALALVAVRRYGRWHLGDTFWGAFLTPFDKERCEGGYLG